MIRLVRERTPEAVHARFRDVARRERQEVKLLTSYHATDGHPEFDSSWWKDAKPQLKVEASNKCAYCEADVSVVAHGDVEHFRPKDVYWWLAYCYDNYSYSCQICNQTYKGKEFPVHGVKLPEPDIDGLSATELEQVAGSTTPHPLDEDPRYPLEEFAADCRREKAGLPDPYFVDPERLFTWKVDGAYPNFRVSIAARTNAVAARRAFDAVVQYLGLNREQLLIARGEVYRQLDLLRRSHAALLDSDDPMADDIVTEVRHMAASRSKFAGMVRHFAREEWHLDV